MGNDNEVFELDPLVRLLTSYSEQITMLSAAVMELHSMVTRLTQENELFRERMDFMTMSMIPERERAGYQSYMSRYIKQ